MAAFLAVGNLELLVEVHNLEVHCNLEEAFLEVLHILVVAFHLEGVHSREDILAYYEI